MRVQTLTCFAFIALALGALATPTELAPEKPEAEKPAEKPAEPVAEKPAPEKLEAEKPAAEKTAAPSTGLLQQPGPSSPNFSAGRMWNIASHNNNLHVFPNGVASPLLFLGPLTMHERDTAVLRAHWGGDRWIVGVHEARCTNPHHSPENFDYFVIGEHPNGVPMSDGKKFVSFQTTVNPYADNYVTIPSAFASPPVCFTNLQSLNDPTRPFLRPRVIDVGPGHLVVSVESDRTMPVGSNSGPPEQLAVLCVDAPTAGPYEVSHPFDTSFNLLVSEASNNGNQIWFGKSRSAVVAQVGSKVGGDPVHVRQENPDVLALQEDNCGSDWHPAVERVFVAQFNV